MDGRSGSGAMVGRGAKAANGWMLSACTGAMASFPPVASIKRPSLAGARVAIGAISSAGMVGNTIGAGGMNNVAVGASNSTATGASAANAWLVVASKWPMAFQPPMRAVVVSAAMPILAFRFNFFERVLVLRFVMIDRTFSSVQMGDCVGSLNGETIRANHFVVLGVDQSLNTRCGCQKR
jgi:hypothetical protein